MQDVVDLARARNVEVSAEGIENAAQHLRVVDHGCDYAQGYFFARPIAGSLVPKMLGSWAPFLPARGQARFARGQPSSALLSSVSVAYPSGLPPTVAMLARPPRGP